jgi:hypothetical protein
MKHFGSTSMLISNDETCFSLRVRERICSKLIESVFRHYLARASHSNVKSTKELGRQRLLDYIHYDSKGHLHLAYKWPTIPVLRFRF